METILIPGGLAAHGKITAISSKSDLHRLIICACLSDKGCEIKYEAKLSKDIEATVACLSAMGAVIENSDGKLIVRKPINRDEIPENCRLDCGESGSTARFLLPIASVLCKKGAVLVGSGKLPERPFEHLCVCLEKHGAVFSSHSLPIEIKETAKPAGLYEITGNVSSQYVTGLLFTLPICDAEGIRLTTELQSSGYVNLTSDAMKRFGVKVDFSDGVYTAAGSYSPAEHTVSAQGDWSNSAFWLCSAREGEEITVDGLDLSSSQPDRKICEILERMGMDISYGTDSVTAKCTERTHGISFDVKNIPDTAPILAARAAVSDGKTVISGIERLRIKESDRVEAICRLINSLGGTAEADEHCIYITGKEKLAGGTVDSFNDHRIAMSAAAAALFSDGDVEITGCRAVEKSYPQFYRHYMNLTGISRLETYDK